MAWADRALSHLVYRVYRVHLVHLVHLVYTAKPSPGRLVMQPAARTPHARAGLRPSNAQHSGVVARPQTRQPIPRHAAMAHPARKHRALTRPKPNPK